MIYQRNKCWLDLACNGIDCTADTADCSLLGIYLVYRVDSCYLYLGLYCTWLLGLLIIVSGWQEVYSMYPGPVEHHLGSVTSQELNYFSQCCWRQDRCCWFVLKLIYNSLLEFLTGPGQCSTRSSHYEGPQSSLIPANLPCSQCSGSL